MTGARRALALLFIVAAICDAPGCARRGDPVATLIDTQGVVERNDGPQAWTGATPGFAFVVGDVLKTSAHAQARLRLTNGTVIRVLENARIRFSRGTLPSAKGANVNVELGAAEIESATADVALVTALGVARVERGARVRLRGSRWGWRRSGSSEWRGGCPILSFRRGCFLYCHSFC